MYELVGFLFFHRSSSCRTVKREPRINLLYEYLLHSYRTYERISNRRLAGCWLKTVFYLLGSLRNSFSLRVVVAESEPESYITINGQSASLSWNKAPIWGLNDYIFIVRQLRVCWCGAPSLTIGRVCHLQLLLALASYLQNTRMKLFLKSAFFKVWI
jgi:hypothetical protein